MEQVMLEEIAEGNRSAAVWTIAYDGMGINLRIVLRHTPKFATKRYQSEFH
jgi:hypothetical protein